MDSAAEMLRDTTDRLLAEHVTPQVLRDAERGVWAEGLWAAVEEAGLTRALLPEAAGGYGVDPRDALRIVRVAGAHAAPAPLAETMLAGWLLGRAGMPMPSGPLTVGVVDGGVAVRVPWGRYAAAVVLLQRDGIALVAPDACRIETGENLAREPRDTLRVAAADWREADVSAPQLRAAGAAMRVQQIAGALGRITEMTVQYAQDRVQFGRPIGRFQAVQQNLSVLAAQTAAASAAADLAAEVFGDDPDLLAIAAAKSRAGEAAGVAATIAHQAHGAIGFTYEHSLHFLTKRLWSWRDEFGNEAEWNALLGRHMAAQGADRLWETLTGVG